LKSVVDAAKVGTGGRRDSAPFPVVLVAEPLN
jgi:hypothetical protein